MGLKSTGGHSAAEQQQLLALAIETHEATAKKKWTNMTPFEKSKVQDTYARLLRETRYGKKRPAPAQHARAGVWIGPDLPRGSPRAISRDLSQCLNAHEIKAHPSRHTKIAERAFGQVRVTSPVGHISEATLRDGERLIVKLTQLRDQDAQHGRSQYMHEENPYSPSQEEEGATPMDVLPP